MSRQKNSDKETKKIEYRNKSDKSNNSDELQQLQQDNSFQRVNQVYDLKSQINLLKIEKQRLSLEHEQVMSALQQKNKQLMNQNNRRKRDNSNLQLTVKRLEQQNQQLKSLIQNHRHQVDNNRKTADFHHSIQDAGGSGASQLINELLLKDKTIQQLRAKLQMKDQGGSQAQRQQQIRTFRRTIEELKSKQTAYKAQYQQMLRAKQEVIQRLSQYGNESSRKMSQSRDKQLSQLNKQLQKSYRMQESYKQKLKEIQERYNNLENMVDSLNVQLTKKEKQLLATYEEQKQAYIKSMVQKTKKIHKQKQQRIKKLQERVYELQNQGITTRQQLNKYKIQITTLQKLNSFLEQSSKQIQTAKNKYQMSLFEKQKQNGQLRQRYFREISEIKKGEIQQKKVYEQKILKLQQQIIAKQYINQKLQKSQEEKAIKSELSNIKQQNELLNQIQNLRFGKAQANNKVIELQARLKQKSQKFYQLQTNMRVQYQSRLNQMQVQLNRLRLSAHKQKKELIQQNLETKQTQEGKYKKLQMVCQLLQIEKEQKTSCIKKMGEEKIVLEGQLKQLRENHAEDQKKIKQLKQDYRTLQILHQELNDKYKRGVSDLQSQIQKMTHIFQQQRHKADRKRAQWKQNEELLNTQLATHKQQIRQLQSQLDGYKTNKIEDNLQQEQKIEKLQKENLGLNRQKQMLSGLVKKYNHSNKQKENGYQQQKNKLMEYITELEQNTSILNTKLAIMANKQSSYQNQLDMLIKQHNNLKVQYSLSLEQLNGLLIKCRQLQQVGSQSISHMENMRHKYQQMKSHFDTVSFQKTRVEDQLANVYEQVNRLNYVLMDKEQIISQLKQLGHHRINGTLGQEARQPYQQPRQLQHIHQQMQNQVQHQVQQQQIHKQVQQQHAQVYQNQGHQQVGQVMHYVPAYRIIQNHVLPVNYVQTNAFSTSANLMSSSGLLNRGGVPNTFVAAHEQKRQRKHEQQKQPIKDQQERKTKLSPIAVHNDRQYQSSNRSGCVVFQNKANNTPINMGANMPHQADHERNAVHRTKIGNY